MRLISLIFVVITLNACSHSPPIYTPSRTLIDQRSDSNTMSKSSARIVVNKSSVVIEDASFQIIERYTSALDKECVRYLQPESHQLETSSIVCKVDGKQWSQVKSLK